MSGDVSDRKRLIAVTDGNIEHKHIYLSGHHDFFPKESYGASNGKERLGVPLTLNVDGLANPVETDLASRGGQRYFFRKRGWVRRFFEKHEIQPGDVIAIERLGKHEYRVYPFESKNVCQGTSIPDHWAAIAPKQPTVIDLFSGQFQPPQKTLSRCHANESWSGANRSGDLIRLPEKLKSNS